MTLEKTSDSHHQVSCYQCPIPIVQTFKEFLDIARKVLEFSIRVVTLGSNRVTRIGQNYLARCRWIVEGLKTWHVKDASHSCKDFTRFSFKLIEESLLATMTRQIREMIYLGRWSCGRYPFKFLESTYHRFGFGLSVLLYRDEPHSRRVAHCFVHSIVFPHNYMLQDTDHFFSTIHHVRNLGRPCHSPRLDTPC